jgi:hypothetical protein
MRREALALLFVAACQGGFVDAIQPPLQQGDTPGDVIVLPDGGTAVVPKPPTTGDTKACAPRVEARLALLSDLQQLTALRAMLGEDSLTGEDLPQAQLKPFMQKGTVVNTSLVHTRNEWARMASEGKPPQHGCSDASCAEKFLRTFTARAFRRPVEDEEIEDLMEVYALAAQQSPAHGVQRAVEAVLAAPSFAFRREIGSSKDGVRELDAYELASVLSFAVSDGPPDDELWAAAGDGSLLDPTERKKQVTRLLAKESVRETVTGTLLAAWGLGNLFGAAKDPTLFPSFTPQLMASMYHETELMVSDVLWTRGAPVSELLSTHRSFVDAPLAALYGLPAPKAAFSEVELPAAQRSGLLTQASVLAMLSRSDTTSVVARGLFVRGLLCMAKTPSPPESLTDAISDLLKQDLSERERAAVRAKNPTCGGCHAGIDPYGLLLESYDPLGRFRTSQDDAPVEVKGAFAGSYESATDFIATVADADDFGHCVATRVLSYALQDDALAPKDCQVKEALEGTDPTALEMEDLMQRMLSSPSIAYRKEAP